MAHPQKEMIVKELADKLKCASAAILTDYRGLNCAELTDLRGRLRGAHIEYRVVKDTLARFAAQKLNLDGFVPYLFGPTAIAFGYEDPIVPARVLVNFARKNPNLAIKAGLLEGGVVGLEKVEELARLPGKDALYSMVIGSIKLPIGGLVNVLQANLKRLVCVLDAICKQKE